MTTPSIWTGMYCEQPLAESLRTLHACGWSALEVSTEHLARIEGDPDGDGRIDEALRVVEELGLELPQSHGHLGADVAHSDLKQREADVQRLVRHIDISARLGVKTVVVRFANLEPA